MITVYGAGSVGLVVGTRLARAGERVLFVTRRAEAAERIASEGVRVEEVGSGETWSARAEATASVAEAAARIGDGPVLFLMRGAELEAAAAALAAVVPDAPVACFLNDVHHEEMLARHFSRVTAVAVRQTCTRTAPNAAVTVGSGRLVLGAWPSGRAPEADLLAEKLRQAGYDVGVSENAVEDKWLKLVVNLMSAPNALVRRQDHATRAFVETKARLLEEARDALAAAGIVARSCDGRDRSIDEEIAWQRESLARGRSARDLPVYNQVWAALRHGGSLEADGYHRRILDLAREHALPAPVNARVLSALERAWSEKRGPESVSAEDLLASGGAT